MPPTPLAIKALGIAHKTEAGAVRLGSYDPLDIEHDIKALLPLGEGVLVESMIEGGLVEMIVGLSRDPAYGLMLTVGAGGVMAELLGDTATMLLPVTDAKLREAIGTLKVAKLLAGWRGKPAADLDAAVEAILAVARFAEVNADTLEELDINPLIVCEKGAYAADALIRIRT